MCRGWDAFRTALSLSKALRRVVASCLRHLSTQLPLTLFFCLFAKLNKEGGEIVDRIHIQISWTLTYASPPLVFYCFRCFHLSYDYIILSLQIFLILEEFRRNVGSSPKVGKIPIAWWIINFESSCWTRTKIN